MSLGTLFVLMNRLLQRCCVIHLNRRNYVGAVRVLPMPRLSPSMKEGTITQWHCKPGDLLQTYDLLFDVRPDELVAVKLEGESHPEMEVESTDEMYLVKVFGNGRTFAAGTPVAILCECQSDIAEAQRIDLPLDVDVYDSTFPVALWQAYTKHATK